MLYLRAFGGLCLENGGRPIVGAATQRARLAMLALLATAGDRGASRDRLLGLFWADKDEEHGRAALRQALYTLRRDCGETDLIVGTTDLALNRDVIGADLLDFDAALEAQDLERATDVYAGGLLDGVYLRDVPEFERWTERERDRRLHQYRAALEQLANAATARGEFQRAGEFLTKLAASDPLSAASSIALMKALVRAGDHSAAVQHARDYERLVRAELDVAPDPSVVALADDIRASLAAQKAPHNTAADLHADRSGARPAKVVDAREAEIPSVRSVLPRTSRGLRLALFAGVGAVVLSAAFMMFRAVREAHGHAPLAYRRTAIAVLPFQNLSAEPSHAYFARGLHDELLTQLQRVADLKVTSG